MNLQQKYKGTLELLTRYNQGHLLAFYDLLNDQQKQDLFGQIEFPAIGGWVTLPHYDPMQYAAYSGQHFVFDGHR